MDEKDRLGDKLRGKEKADEDRYFARRDRELLEKLKKGQEATAGQTALMRCPKCGTGLVTQQLHDVTVEECPACKGMWLDRGELETLAKRENEGWVGRFLRRGISS